MKSVKLLNSSLRKFSTINSQCLRNHDRSKKCLILKFFTMRNKFKSLLITIHLIILFEIIHLTNSYSIKNSRQKKLTKQSNEHHNKGNSNLINSENSTVIDESSLHYNKISANSQNKINTVLMEQPKHKLKHNNKNDLVTYIRASIPIRIFQCMRKLTILRCMKLFLLQKMEINPNFKNTGNLTEDFLNQFLVENYNLPALTDKKYKKLNDTELTRRLVNNLQRFFRDREIKLHFIPGILVDVIPSDEDKIKFSLKDNEVTGRKKKDKTKLSYKNTMVQMAVPVMMMPAILLGTFLPFMLPALKMATIMSTLLNNGALIAALLYAARTSAQQNKAEIIHYAHAGYAH